MPNVKKQDLTLATSHKEAKELASHEKKENQV
jgi:hypothetical protein